MNFINNNLSIFIFAFFLFCLNAFSQEKINTNKFRQLNQEFSSPNMFRTASGAPGPEYYQQQADYKINIELDDINKKIYGDEIITYTNNSPEKLDYLWVQLDQNIRSKDSQSLIHDSDNSIQPAYIPDTFDDEFLGESFDGGFNIEYVRSLDNKNLDFFINQTMMRIDLPNPIATGQSFSFKIKWWYNINNRLEDRGRSGYETFPNDDNRAYTIAQFFPRMCVYDEVEGWQNYQFWGDGEFALPFGNYEVNITVPADHILEATGELINRKEVYSKEMLKRYNRAKKSYDKPVIIVSQEEAEIAEKSFSKSKKTWKFIAKNVRDFAFATSRKYILDMMAVKIGSDDVMAVSLYPKEGNPIWEDFSTITVVETLKFYSDYTFNYPYHKAVSVHAHRVGMEYPMICFNFGRPNIDGSYSDDEKFGMIGVIIHEIGHFFFPMIVNSDERQWAWMDEGINTFVQYLAEQEFGKKYPDIIHPYKNFPSDRGPAELIVDYMSVDQNFLAPIMSNPENVYSLGPNAYGKPATALNILRETVMGKDLFDYAFKKYSNRWKFKHPTPEDFFRTMEDASAVDLDWFWRGWFYTTDYVDIAIKEVKEYFVSPNPSEEFKKLMIEEMGIPRNRWRSLIFLDKLENDSENNKENQAIENSKLLNNYLKENYSNEQIEDLNVPNFYYEIIFEKPGGLVMPIIIDIEYDDGTIERKKYPAQVWRKNDSEVRKVLTSNKKILSVILDPDKETADIDTSNNSWPEKEIESEFDKFKSKIKG
ncbi:MAG: M1 family metallopeptidase [Flavobacteriaceae bacterium]|nr:M1 family metallopeptidase [Flavobacteriaceae bacterium]